MVGRPEERAPRPWWPRGHERPRAVVLVEPPGGGERHLLGAERLHGVKALPAALEQDANEVDDDVGVAHGGFDRSSVPHVGLHRVNLADPAEPLYFMKAPSSTLNPGETIVAPAGQGKIVYEGELAIVIGQRAKAVSEDAALAHVFGYTCCNDVTAAEVLNRDASFAQWVRAKSYDSFCPLGPCIATGLDPSKLIVKTWLDGQLSQDYPVADIRFNVPRLVSLLSHDMTLEPGDVILCGTSVGVGSMKPGSTVEIEIEGIGKLSNSFEAQKETS